MDNKDMGWVSIYRSLLCSALWLEEPFTRGQAWVDLIGIANWKPGTVRKRGIRVPVARGQVGWSIRRLAERWGWAPSTVKLFLNELKDEAQIEYQSGNVTTIITIINYEEYQNNEAQIEPQTEHRPSTDQPQAKTNNKDKEVNKEIITEPGGVVPSSEDILSNIQRVSFDVFWSLWPKGKKKSKGAAEKAWKKIAPENKLLPFIMNGLKRAKASKEWAKDGGQYIPHPATWLNAKGWEDEYEAVSQAGKGNGSKGPDALERMQAEMKKQEQEGQPL